MDDGESDPAEAGAPRQNSPIFNRRGIGKPQSMDQVGRGDQADRSIGNPLIHDEEGEILPRNSREDVVAHGRVRGTSDRNSREKKKTGAT